VHKPPLINAPQTASVLVAQATRKRPAPPRRLPPNRVRPGGGLDTAKQSCKDSPRSLAALVPVENPVFTTSAHPTLLFYVADAAADIREGTFSVFTEDDKTRVYETRFTLPKAPGLISIRLPELPNTSLQAGQSYQWYFKLYCQGSNNPKADLYVNGWIQRVELTLERQRSIDAIATDVWYDSLASLAQRLQATPQDAALRQQWNTLLQSIGLADLTTQPFTPVVTKEVPRANSQPGRR
jgi:hypothetical protein